MVTTTKIELTFAQMESAIDFVKQRFSISNPTDAQLAIMLNREFNTSFTALDISRHKDTTIKDLQRDIMVHNKAVGFLNAMYHPRAEDDGVDYYG